VEESQMFVIACAFFVELMRLAFGLAVECGLPIIAVFCLVVTFSEVTS
jgi:hypothetical protein